MKKSKRHANHESRPAMNTGEIRRDVIERVAVEKRWRIIGDGKPPDRVPRNYKYVDELVRLQFELLKMQEWVRLQGMKVCVLFEGRDAAGKGGVIKRMTQRLNRGSAALPAGRARPCLRLFIQIRYRAVHTAIRGMT